MDPVVVLLGTLDTKGTEYRWLRERLIAAGCRVVLVDAGVPGDPDAGADVPAERVAAAAGADPAALREAADRGAAMSAMGRGAAAVLAEQHRRGELDAVLALGGSGGAAITAAALRALPVGVPKLLVSTMVSGDVADYVGGSDVTLMYSVTDVSGINRISRQVLGNAAGAAVGMAGAHAARRTEPQPAADRPLVAASMFGVTTPAVTAARERLEELGYDVLVFHATGTGGRALESLAAGGDLAGVLDLTTTELADELLGGVLSAGPDRLRAAGRAGLPQVVSLGALDMCNFGPRSTVPEHYAQRNLVEHNAQVTLMRTEEPDMAQLGRTLGERLAAAAGPTAVFVPERGVSALDVHGGPFRDAAADAACTAALADALVGTGVEQHRIDAHINDPAFARAAAERLHELITTASTGPVAGAGAAQHR
ncbi:Tm-1-like ATP-binding domain-containing protein [Saccharopolyspora sp. HNM0983]|uniref:Tm-1-like ATP-binding domain-containing protein n=1 Tax=Saccharopolyspora montiporae TaxID=2781240 RepID=A0A929B7G9_9PSEU|nr:Tm-1-like ATP-binding domain-containing protein [Saccharopolyspora sp. HNM0983]MBE9373003.1 Tm-1-like ATP-binding domain-containing protein [Saccharopolyspora sp. HNM0983]